MNSLYNRHPSQGVGHCQPPTPEASQATLPNHNALFPPRNHGPDSNEYNCLVSLYLLFCHFTIHPKMVSFTLSIFERYIVQNHRVYSLLSGFVLCVCSTLSFKYLSTLCKTLVCSLLFLNIIPLIYLTAFGHLMVLGHLRCFHIVVITDNAAMYIYPCAHMYESVHSQDSQTSVGMIIGESL